MKNTSITKPAKMSLALLALMALPVCAHQPMQEPSGAAGRMAPPAALACDRNQLTSYQGVVTNYHRGTASTKLTIHTDWDTVESLTLRHTGADGPLQYFLLNGQAFTKNDWARIESESGMLVEGVRAIAWVCADPNTPTVIDWRPGSSPELTHGI